MLVIVGVAIAFLGVLIGFIMDGGNIAVLIQPNEIIILTGAAVGSFLAANGMDNIKATTEAIKGLLRPDPYKKESYIDLFKLMFQLFVVARKDGLLGLEKHIENPEESDIIKKYPSFLSNKHATHFLCDTMKVILTGTVSPHDLSEMMELDLEISHQESRLPVDALQTVGDAMPGFGIVAAVLGVIITMGKIGGGAGEIGHSVSAALVGTFLGILLAYGFFSPLARAIDLRVKSAEQYLNSIRFALVSFARGEAPITCVEFARRNIEPAVRPTFMEMEGAVREQKSAA